MISYCKKCEKLFNKTDRNICPSCVREEQSLVKEIQDFLRQNRDATIGDVADALDIPLEVIEDLIDEGVLMTRGNPNLMLTCTRCGEASQDGRMCANCRSEMVSNLNNARTRVEMEQRPQARFHTR